MVNYNYRSFPKAGQRILIIGGQSRMGDESY